MIENHTCPHCGRPGRVWLPIKITKPPVVQCDSCGRDIDYSWVYTRRESMSVEMLELKQLAYLKRKYE